MAMTRVLVCRRTGALAACFALALASSGCGSDGEEPMAAIPIDGESAVARSERDEGPDSSTTRRTRDSGSEAFAARRILEAPALPAAGRSPDRTHRRAPETTGTAPRDFGRDPESPGGDTTAQRNAGGGTRLKGATSPGLSAGGRRGDSGGEPESGVAIGGGSADPNSKSDAGGSGPAPHPGHSPKAGDLSDTEAPPASQTPLPTNARFEGEPSTESPTSVGSFTTFGPSADATATRGSATIPPPFEPLHVSAVSGGYDVRAWGRHYRFNGPLPHSIISQERELLAAPAAIVVGGMPLTWGPVRLAESRTDRILLEADAVRGELEFHAAVLIEYDGMIQVDLSVSGAGEIPPLAYELSLRSDRATLFNHHLVYDFSSQNIVKGSTLNAAGATPSGTRRYDFVPSFWLGDRDVGIEWWSESNAHWHGPETTRPYELRRGNIQTLLRIEPITAPYPLASEEVWRDRVALFPMPMRPQARNWRAVRFTSQGTSTPAFDATIGTRLAWVAFGSAFSARWHGLPHSKQDAPQSDLRRRLSRRPVAYIPYGKLTVAPSKHPKAMAMFKQWSASGSWFRNSPGDELSVLKKNGTEFDPSQPVSYGVCMGRKDYLDWLLAENVKAFETEDLDGLYFDFGAISRMCVNSPALAGKSGREVWEYTNIREFYKRLYAAMKERNPDALLVIHSVGQPRALSAFTDFHWVGEHFNGIFSGGANMSSILANPTQYKPDYLALPDGFLDATTLPHVGGTWVVLPQIKFARDPAVTEPAHRSLHGWALASDVPLVLGNTHNNTGVGILRALDRFGSLRDATFEPWWSKDRAVTADPPFRASAYHAAGRALIVVLNPGTAETTRSVVLDVPALQLGGASGWRDLETDDPPLPLSNGRLSVRVGPHDFRILAVE